MYCLPSHSIKMLAEDREKLEQFIRNEKYLEISRGFSLESIYLIPFLSFSSTMTLNVPDTAERKLKDDGLRPSLAPTSSYTWLVLFLGLSILVAIFLISLLLLRCKNRLLKIAALFKHFLYLSTCI